MPSHHVDIVIVGAGLSGIGAACRLRQRRPHDTIVVLEARSAMGGTWDLFCYPGVRSDSDMYTLGYDFEPWVEAEAIADGPAILSYIRRTAHRYGVDALVRYRHRVTRADWSSAQGRWTVLAERSVDQQRGADEPAEQVRFICRWVHLCTGYYHYDAGYVPDLTGIEDFRGTVVHPQDWPDDLDYTGQQVVVVGSGATAVTLVPALAQRAEHVTMLQRSPTYVLPLPRRDRVADALRQALPQRAAHRVLRWRNAMGSLALVQASRRWPAATRRYIRRRQSTLLPAADLDEHFTPAYDPWSQRLCLAADGDLFTVLADGRASMVTERIDRVTEEGVRVASGREIAADLLVLATGLRLLAFGGIVLAVDGEPKEPGNLVVYKGMMLGGLPNLSFTVGYTSASWTLKADLVAVYLIRLLGYLDERGYASVVPEDPPSDEPRRPLLDLDASYIRRSEDDLPRQGSRTPWALHQNYPRDVLLLRHGRLDDEGVRFVPTRP